jgi:hypothetical protein
MSKKLVGREYLNYVQEELFSIKLQCSLKTQERISGLLQYIETNIIHSDKELLNEIKKVVYLNMKNAKTEKESKKWYNYYQNLK